MNITESKIRDEINGVLKDEYFYSKSKINENYAINLAPGEFSKIFWEPWQQAFKGIFAELKKITSSALTLVRVSFTLNQKKAQEIIARHKDRMKQFSKESDDAMSQLPSADLDFITFIVNPGPWAARKIAAGGVAAVGFAKEVGIGDKSIATAKGEEKEEDALIRRRDQDGPVKKALRALEQIFFLAHAAPSGPLIVEAIEADINDEIMAGPLGNEIKKQKNAFMSEIDDFVSLVNTIAAQNAFLSIIARIETAENPLSGLREMEAALATLTRDDPESAKEFSMLPGEIQKEAAQLARSEKFKSEVDKQYPDDKDGIDYEKQALHTVMGAAFADNYTDYMRAIMDNNELLDQTFQALFDKPEIDKELANSIDSDTKGFSAALRTAEKVLQRRLIS